MLSTTSTDNATHAGKRSRRRALASAPRSTSSILFLVLLVIVFSVTTKHFFTGGNITTVLFVASVLILGTIAQSVVVVTQNLDLSVGAVMAAAAYIPLLLLGRSPTLLTWYIPFALAIGVVLGLVNGVLVAFLKIPSLIATLGTMSLFRGLVYAVGNGTQISVNQQPGWILAFISKSLFSIPLLVFFTAIVAVVVALFLRRNRYGRMFYAVGSSTQASIFYGLPKKRVVLAAFSLGGFIAAIAGVFLAAQAGTVTVDIATGYELQTLAAAVIGGLSLFGGTGSVIGATAGALVIAVLNNGLVQLGLSGYWQGFIQGCAIVAAVAFDVIVKAREKRLNR